MNILAIRSVCHKDREFGTFGCFGSKDVATNNATTFVQWDGRILLIYVIKGGCIDLVKVISYLVWHGLFKKIVSFGLLLLSVR